MSVAPRWSIEGVSTRPGVYLFRDEGGSVLYVGKARNLRARLSSYRRPGRDGRLGVLFIERDARAVETIVTRTEGEALLLEDTLIKQHKPPHNVRLKDDKSFLMIRVDLDERFPRLKFVRAHRPRQGKQKGAGRSRLFGPYPSASSVRHTLSDLHRVVPLRDCTDAVLDNRSRPCLKHQIGLCCAPCVDLVDAGEYAEHVERALAVLGGDTLELERDLEQRMRAASEAQEYERAGSWRDRLRALRRTVEGQGVRPRDRVERDVLAWARRGQHAAVHRLAFKDGRLAESRSFEFRSELPDEELCHVILTALYGGGRRALPAEGGLPCAPTEPELLEASLGREGLRLLVPGAGERRRMLEMAGENARVHLEKRLSADESDQAALAQLVSLVDLPSDCSAPVIDTFDVSNFQGAHVVASRVRFRNGRSDRSGYRRFKLRGVDGQDDFAAMREVVLRSLRRGMREDELPDLVVIDGGPQQLAKAIEAREEAGAWEVRVVSLAKARRERRVGGALKPASEERVFLDPESEGVELARNTAVRHLFERMRDEAHRFAITYHRKERGKIRSQLDSIPGIGPVRRKALLRRFGSVQGVARASVEELAAMPGIGAELARLILDRLGS